MRMMLCWLVHFLFGILILLTVSSSSPSSLSSTATATATDTSSITTNQNNDNNQSNKKKGTFECFRENSELLDAVDYYYYEDDTPNSYIAEKYGWPMNEWCLDYITSLDNLFEDKIDFNEDISNWNVSNVKTFQNTFTYAQSFNQPIGKWDVSSANIFKNMFWGAKSFCQDLSSWDVSNAWMFYAMFEDMSCNNLNISSWDVSNGGTFNYMFMFHPTFNDDITRWNVSSATILSHMFKGATEFNQDLSGWDVSNVRGFQSMFESATAFTSDLSGWDVSSGNDFQWMFNNATSFISNLSTWHTHTDAWETEVDMIRYTSSMLQHTQIKDIDLTPPFCKNVENSACYGGCHVQPKTHWISKFYDLFTARKITMILPKFFAFASICGSTWIIYELVGANARVRRQKMKMSFFRILLVLSMFDIVSSIGFFLSSWAVPASPPPPVYQDGSLVDCWAQLDHELMYPYAAGTVFTCSLQGFLIQFGLIGSVLITGALSLNCYFVVRHNWREEKLKFAEKFGFPSVLLFAIGSATYLAATKSFNPVSPGFCWIGIYPRFNDGSGGWYQEYYYPDIIAYPENVRGDPFTSTIYTVVFALLWVFLVLVVIAFSMISIFCYVRNSIRRLTKYGEDSINNSSSNNNNSNKRKRRLSIQLSTKEQTVVTKGMAYIGGFLGSYTLAVVGIYANLYNRLYMDCLVACMLSCQGLINVMVYSGKGQIIWNCMYGCFSKMGTVVLNTVKEGYKYILATNKTQKSSSDINSNTTTGQGREGSYKQSSAKYKGDDPEDIVVQEEEMNSSHFMFGSDLTAIGKEGDETLDDPWGKRSSTTTGFKKKKKKKFASAEFGLSKSPEFRIGEAMISSEMPPVKEDGTNTDDDTLADPWAKSSSSSVQPIDAAAGLIVPQPMPPLEEYDDGDNDGREREDDDDTLADPWAKSSSSSSVPIDAAVGSRVPPQPMPPLEEDDDGDDDDDGHRREREKGGAQDDASTGASEVETTPACFDKRLTSKNFSNFSSTVSHEIVFGSSFTETESNTDEILISAKEACGSHDNDDSKNVADVDDDRRFPA